MGNAFLHGQGGSSGAKVASGTFSFTQSTLSYTIQLSTDFVPDHILVLPIANTSTYQLYGITGLSYDRSTDSWVVLYKMTQSSSNIFFYTQDSYVASDYGQEFIYDESSASITITGSTVTTNRYPFILNTTYKWVMWKD